MEDLPRRGSSSRGESEGVWLGGRDSNPDNMLQRHVSYRWTTSQYQPSASTAETSIIAARNTEPASARRLAPGRRHRCRRRRRIAAADRLRRRRCPRSRCRFVGSPPLCCLLAAMARHPALAAGFARFLARPLVRGALLVRRLAALARNLALLVAVHRSKSAILFCHRALLPGRCPRTLACTASRSAREHSGCNRCATDLP